MKKIRERNAISTFNFQNGNVLIFGQSQLINVASFVNGSEKNQLNFKKIIY